MRGPAGLSRAEIHDVETDLALLGAASDTGPNPVPGMRPAASCLVWPENAAALHAFLVVATQWRVATVGGGLTPGRVVRTGLAYDGVRAGLALAGIRPTPDLFADLQVMEAAALDAFANDAFAPEGDHG